MDIQEFFKKNIRYVALILLALFFVKSFQSCNRNMQVKKLEKEIVYLNDSLTNIHGSEKSDLLLELRVAEDSISELNYLVKIANSEKNAAERRAEAIQSTAEKIKGNTTIRIESRSEKDSISQDNR
jgi:limonene-1,2-epoxide hydrolase